MKDQVLLKIYKSLCLWRCQLMFLYEGPSSADNVQDLVFREESIDGVFFFFSWRTKFCWQCTSACVYGDVHRWLFVKGLVLLKISEYLWLGWSQLMLLSEGPNSTNNLEILVLMEDSVDDAFCWRYTSACVYGGVLRWFFFFCEGPSSADNVQVLVFMEVSIDATSLRT